MFAEKLDFLMKLTGARNSELGRAAHVDASTVSRLRVGKRELPKRQNFLPLMCDYFARNISTPYQRQSAADAVRAEWPEDNARAAALMLAWLTRDDAPDDVAVSRLVSSIANFSFKAPDRPEQPAPSPDDKSAQSAEPVDIYYYGNAGKRAAVARFLSAVIDADRPRTLLLYSDETLDWLYEDADFARQWAGLMQRAIQRGNRIRIVHTVGRTLEEMLEALDKWIGVYMTGAIEPYYCPRLRDGIARRTLFIAPELAAVAASSVEGDTSGALNLYVGNANAVNALESEFNGYFALCVPLMRILTSDGIDAARGLLRELTDADGDMFIVHGAPSLATMPDSVVQSIYARCRSAALLEMRDEAVDAFHKSVTRAPVYEVLALPERVDFRENGVAVSDLGLKCNPKIYYTKEEYAAHLASVAETLQKYKNYHVVLPATPSLPPNMALYHKARVGTVIARTDGLPIVFAINEARMTAAFNEYLARQVAGAETSKNRRYVLSRLAATLFERRF